MNSFSGQRLIEKRKKGKQYSICRNQFKLCAYLQLGELALLANAD